MTSSAPGEVALQETHEKWFRRIPSAWLVAIALVVLIAISAVRLILIDWIGSGPLMVGPVLIPFLVGGLLLLWRLSPDRHVAELGAVAFFAGAVSALVALGAHVFIKGFEPTVSGVVLWPLIAGVSTTFCLLPVGLYVLKSRSMLISVAMGLSAVMLTLPVQPFSNIAIFVIAYFVLRRVDQPAGQASS
jgi:hypothetical protein